MDTEHCGPVIAYEPLSSAIHWTFIMKGFGVGNAVRPPSFEVITDTGTSFIGGPKSQTDWIAKKVGAKYLEKYRLYHIPCDAKLPYFHIYIGSKTYSIEPANYLIEVSLEDQCKSSDKI
ncbi:unnamed protein product [Strongylus vulgaris]|uniref:Peptidase A1 domain-containing protein n=1 Tax=Strongylus vulgaris TaxID=40348 RepID=A0A3P7JFL6_STRVU|nr:unnamed protein product [Strongylus vulgaris]